jgi:hypothetical protein
MDGKPFALLGVNTDSDREMLRKVVQKEEINWRSWFDGSTDGPITTRWNVRAFPTIYVLDSRGVIRYKDVRGEQLDRAVDILLKELDGSPR